MLLSFLGLAQLIEWIVTLSGPVLSKPLLVWLWAADLVLKCFCSNSYPGGRKVLFLKGLAAPWIMKMDMSPFVHLHLHGPLDLYFNRIFLERRIHRIALQSSSGGAYVRETVKTTSQTIGVTHVFKFKPSPFLHPDYWRQYSRNCHWHNWLSCRENLQAFVWRLKHNFWAVTGNTARHEFLWDDEITESIPTF